MEHLLRAHDHVWRPGAVALIRQARTAAMDLALVTASHRRLLDALDVTLESTLAQTVGGGSPVFSVTVAGDEVPATKPDPTPYLEAATSVGREHRRMRRHRGFTHGGEIRLGQWSIGHCRTPPASHRTSCAVSRRDIPGGRGPRHVACVACR